MCGLFGFCSNKDKQINLLKIKILGLYNISRGVDSCGYYFSGYLEKGLDKNKNFGDFIADKGIIRGDSPVDMFLGHTRKATYGQHNEKNAHPHVINDNYVQTHNGVIKNELDLTKKYDISFSDGPIDSLVLANIIERNGFGVLEEYTGYAALAITYKNNPESLFLYHGARREYTDDVLLTIERPLFILNQPEGLYYSSMSESLAAINDDPEKYKIVSLPVNKVYEIKNGEFTQNVIDINRENLGTINRPVTTNNGYVPYKQSVLGYLGKHNSYGKSNNNSSSSNQIDNTEMNENDLIFNELIDSTYPDIYYRNGRYYGRSNILLNGRYVITRSGKIVSNFTNVSNEFTEEYYFIHGVMMKDRNAFSQCTALSINRFVNNTAQELSKFSRYPVICLKDEYTSFKHLPSRYLWHENGSIIKGKSTIRAKFSNKSYRIKNGKTINTKLLK